jgi:ethanolamine utilization microcompartment shell protein EutL
VTAIALPAPAMALAASKPAFKLTTASGKSGSFAFSGYEFSSGLTPKLGRSGTVEVDVLVASPSEKALLKDGALKSATLHVVATLPKKVNTTYMLVGAKITSVSFVTGHFGPSAAVDLSYKKLTA